MPYMPPVKEGLLSDVVNNLTNMVPNLPTGIDDALKEAVKTAVAVVDPDQPTPQIEEAPKILPELDGDKRNEVVKSLDTVISAIGVALRFRWLIPDAYEKPLEILAKALEKVRSWVD